MLSSGFRLIHSVREWCRCKRIVQCCMCFGISNWMMIVMYWLWWPCWNPNLMPALRQSMWSRAWFHFDFYHYCYSHLWHDAANSLARRSYQIYYYWIYPNPSTICRRCWLDFLRGKFALWSLSLHCRSIRSYESYAWHFCIGRRDVWLSIGHELSIQRWFLMDYSFHSHSPYPALFLSLSIALSLSRSVFSHEMTHYFGLTTSHVKIGMIHRKFNFSLSFDYYFISNSTSENRMRHNFSFANSSRTHDSQIFTHLSDYFAKRSLSALTHTQWPKWMSYPKKKKNRKQHSALRSMKRQFLVKN